MTVRSALDERFRPSLPVLPTPLFSLTDVGGLRASGVSAGIKPSGRRDVGLLVSDRLLSVAGVFTQNLLAAAPVELCRAHLSKTRGHFRALVVSSGNANACTGAQGEADALEMCERVARSVGCAVEEVLVCSTGVIGQKLPMERVRAGIDLAVTELSSEPGAAQRFVEAIMTTDAFAKVYSEGGGDAGSRVAGVCKGAGMIDPDMATMLAFVVTDARWSPETLRENITAVARESFNAVHVDTHPSTNDTFLLISTGDGPEGTEVDLAKVNRVARRLAWMIARDGEGATKVTTITVRGAMSDVAARQVADEIARSALVRTALYGNDPNWGRFVSQVGNSKSVKDVTGLRCVLQGVTVFEKGEPTGFDRQALSAAMKCDDVSLEILLAEGEGVGAVMTSDLSYRYVEVNAEYTT